MMRLLVLVGILASATAEAAKLSYRSIGKAGDYAVGTISASNGSPTVIGNGTAWIAANRGRGDRIRIEGTDYTILSVANDDVLTLTVPFSGSTGSSKSYSISRQFGDPAAWETCISGGGGCGSFPVGGPSLVADDRAEVGVIYADQVYVLSPTLVFEGSITDSDHTITLTADGQNRHQGVGGTGVVLDNGANITSAIEIRDDFVTVEWVEVFNGRSGADGVHVTSLGLPNHIVLRNLLVHNVTGDGIELADPELVADVFNSIVYRTDIGIFISNDLIPGSSLRLVNNTVFGCATVGFRDASSTPVVLVVNNIGASNGSPTGDFSLSGLAPSSGHNLSTDATAPGLGSSSNVPLAAIEFLSTAGGSEDLHIKSGSVARDRGDDMSGLFTIDVDQQARGPIWDVGADEVGPAGDLKFSSAANQSFIVGSPSVGAATISITDDPFSPVVTSANDLRIHIPPGFPMRWDPSAVSLSLGGSAGGKVDPQVAGFDDNGATAVLDVTMDFAAGDDLVIRGLAFFSFTAPAPPQFLGLEVFDDDEVSVLDDKTVEILADGRPTLSSNNDQAFVVGGPITPIAPFTVTDGSVPVIRSLTDIRIRIPAGFPMTWHATDTTASIGGSAAAKVSPSVTYEDGTRTLVLNVLTDFAGSDFVTVSGLSFMNFGGVAGPDELELEVDNLGSVADEDDKRIFIQGATDVPVFTGLATDSASRLEWVFPPTGACIHVRIRRDMAGFPTPFTGTPVVDYPCAGLQGTPGASGETSLANDTDHYYAAFVFTGSSYTPGKFVKVRPFKTSGPVKWAYSTGATSMAPPGLRISGGDANVYIVSNDGILHGLQGGNQVTSGAWIAGYIPYDTGAPVQARPPVVPFAVGQASNGAAFLGSQNGNVLAVDASTGRLEWSRTIAVNVQGAPGGHFTAFDPTASDLVLAGTRNAASGNSLEALKFDGGDPVWSFINDLAQGEGEEIGIISGGPSVDYANQRIYFSSRTRAGGSNATVWAIDLTPSLLWNANLGNIDGSPVLANGRLYVGNNAGVVHALDAATGLLEWSLPLGDGAIKGFLFPKFGTNVLFASTKDRVWAIEDKGASGNVISGWPAAIPSASIPLHPPGSNHVLAGSGDGSLYQIDLALPGSPSSVVLGPGNAAVGAPTLDLVNSMIYVGTEAGIIYAVSYPLP
jgi:outer membrane protein assembly factor BamB